MRAKTFALGNWNGYNRLDVGPCSYDYFHYKQNSQSPVLILLGVRLHTCFPFLLVFSSFLISLVLQFFLVYCAHKRMVLKSRATSIDCSQKFQSLGICVCSCSFCISVHGCQKGAPDISFIRSLSSFETISHWTWNLPMWLEQLTSKSRDLPVSVTPALELQIHCTQLFFFF